MWAGMVMCQRVEEKESTMFFMLLEEESTMLVTFLDRSRMDNLFLIQLKGTEVLVVEFEVSSRLFSSEILWLNFDGFALTLFLIM